MCNQVVIFKRREGTVTAASMEWFLGPWKQFPLLQLPEVLLIEKRDFAVKELMLKI